MHDETKPYTYGTGYVREGDEVIFVTENHIYKAVRQPGGMFRFTSENNPTFSGPEDAWIVGTSFMGIKNDPNVKLGAFIIGYRLTIEVQSGQEVFLSPLRAVYHNGKKVLPKEESFDVT